MALDGARLRPCVNCALDAGHGRVPCVVDVACPETDFDYLPSLYYIDTSHEVHIRESLVG